VVHPGLHASLHVHRRGWWIDPPGSQKEQHSKRPKKRYTDEKPSNGGSERDCLKLGLDVRDWGFDHISE
jgi:hypothetical protein